MRSHYKLIVISSICILANTTSFSQDDFVIQAELDRLEEDSNKVKFISEKATEYFNNNEIQKSLDLISQGKILSKKINYERGIVMCEYLLSEISSRKGNWDWCIKHFKNTLPYFIKYNQKEKLALVYDALGISYMRKGDAEAALTYFFKSLDLYTKLNNQDGISRVYLNLGVCYHDMLEYKKSEIFYTKSLQISRNENNQGRESTLLSNLAYLKIVQNNLDSATFYLEKANEIATKQSNYYLLAAIHGNYGDLDCKRQDYSSALMHYKLGIKYNKISGNIPGIIETKMLISEFFMNEMNNLDSALFYTLEAKNESVNFKNNVFIYRINLLLSKIYERREEHKQSLLFFKNYLIYRDSVINKKQRNKIQEIEYEYELNSKEAEIISLKNEKRIKLLQNLLLYFIIGLMISLLIFIVFKLEKRKKKNQILSNTLDQRNNEVLKLALQIIDTQDFLEELKGINRTLDVNEGNTSSLNELKKIISKTSRRLRKNLRKEDFDIYINEVYVHFINTLERKYTSLTNKEKRLCILIRLGLSSKDISLINGIDEGSVDVSRHRLRKKLNLERKDNLYNTLLQIEI